MDKSRQQFEEWRSKNKSSTINLFDVWQASRESLINNSEPVAWMYPSIGKSDCMVITKSAEESENIEIFFDSHGLPFKVIPLYRLDK
ncbi:hypothetical protein AB7W86_14195 [Providencia rettgeri]